MKPNANMKPGPRLQLFYLEQIDASKAELARLKAQVAAARRELTNVRMQFAAALDDLERAQSELAMQGRATDWHYTSDGLFPESKPHQKTAGDCSECGGCYGAHVPTCPHYQSGQTR